MCFIIILFHAHALCVCSARALQWYTIMCQLSNSSSTTSYLMPVRSSGTGWLVVVFFVGCGRRGRGAWRLFGCRWRRLGGTQGCLQSHQLPLGSLWGGVRNRSVGGNYTVGWIVCTVNFRLLVPSKCKTKLTNRMQAILKHLLTLIDSSVFCFSVRGTSNLNSSRRFQKKSKTFQQLYSCLR